MAKKKSTFTDADDALLAELGVETKVVKAKKYTAEKERVIAGFEEIQRFVAEHGRTPKHGEHNDIFERLYAVRLDRIRSEEKWRELLADMDSDSLLDSANAIAENEAEYEIESDDELLEALGVEAAKDESLTQLKHVRSRSEIKAAEEIARRQRCGDFDRFRHVFDTIQQELDSGQRLTERYEAETHIALNDLFIVEGNKAIVVELGDEFIDNNNRYDRRLRVVYDNGTESNLLLRSMQKALWRDPAGRRIMHVGHDPHPLFSDGKDEESPIFIDENQQDETTGFLYVLRSNAEHPFVVENRNLLHKIGFTRGELKDRFSGASNEPTFLMAEIEVVASYKIVNASAGRLESLLHRFFASARVDVKIRNEVGGAVEPREWFFVSLGSIKKAIELIRTGGITEVRYDLETAKLVPAKTD